MAEMKWQEIPWQSRLRGLYALDEKVLEFLAAQGSSRMLRSQAGHVAVLSTYAALNACADIAIQFDNRVGDDEVIGVVGYGDAPTAVAVEELCDLVKICDYIAVPKTVAQLPQGFTPCGEIGQHSDSSTESVWIVWSGGTSDAELLMRDAPKDLGEPPDNLDARARWYQKRHGCDS